MTRVRDPSALAADYRAALRLLMIAQDFPPSVGGIQTYAHELAHRFARRCARFEVVAPDGSGASAIDAQLPFRVHRLPVGSDGMALATPAVVPLLTRGTFDAVFHGHWYTAGTGLWLRALGRVRRVFVGAHGRELLLDATPACRLLRSGFGRIRREVLGRIDGSFAVSRYTAAILRDLGVEGTRVHVVSGGTDPRRLRPAAAAAADWRRAHGLSDAPILLTLGRLVPRKGIDTVIAALPAIARAVPEVRYVVAGTGPDRARLQVLAHEHGVAHRVVFVGAVPHVDLASVLSAGDVFVMPARSEPPDVEGFGLVFLEAGACARPVVGARAGGIPDAIVDGETGCLVEPDDPLAVAHACVSLLGDPARARAMGEAGRRRVVASCTWDHAADRMLETMGATR